MFHVIWVLESSCLLNPEERFNYIFFGSSTGQTAWQTTTTINIIAWKTRKIIWIRIFSLSKPQYAVEIIVDTVRIFSIPTQTGIELPIAFLRENQEDGRNLICSMSWMSPDSAMFRFSRELIHFAYCFYRAMACNSSPPSPSVSSGGRDINNGVAHPK